MPAAAAAFIALAALAAPVHGQQRGDPLTRNAAYLELGGPGGLYSLNLDGVAGASRVTLRGGATTWASNVDLSRIGMTGVFGGAGRNWDASDFFGQGPGRLVETSAVLFGGRFEDSRGDDPPRSGTLVMVVPSAGLRYQPVVSGWTFRAIVNAYLPLTGEVPVGKRDKPAAGAGFSVGYAW